MVMIPAIHMNNFMKSGLRIRKQSTEMKDCNPQYKYSSGGHKAYALINCYNKDRCCIKPKSKTS